MPAPITSGFLFLLSAAGSPTSSIFSVFRRAALLFIVQAAANIALTERRPTHRQNTVGVTDVSVRSDSFSRTNDLGEQAELAHSCLFGSAAPTLSVSLAALAQGAELHSG